MYFTKYNGIKHKRNRKNRYPKKASEDNYSSCSVGQDTIMFILSRTLTC